MTSKNTFKARNVFGSKLINIERIWAENGIVNVQMKDGAIRQKKVSKAAQEAYVVNQILKRARIHHPHLVRHHEELLAKLMSAINAAASQIEEEQKGAVQVQRMLKHQTPDGRDIADVVGEEENIQYYMDKYPLLEETEVATILRKAEVIDKERMMAAVNNDRVAEIGRQKNSNMF